MSIDDPVMATPQAPPRRSLGQLSPSPPPQESKEKGKVTMSDLGQDLERTTVLLNDAMGHHVTSIL